MYQKGKTRKGKTNLDLLEQEIVSGSGICWAICKSAPHPRQPRQHPTTQFLQARCPSCHPTNSIKALKATNIKSNTTTINLKITENTQYVNQSYIYKRPTCKFNNGSQTLQTTNGN